MATVAIGDVHGNLAALEDVLGLLIPDLTQSDTVVFLGDYIDRGPDTRGCVERIIKLQEDRPCSIVTLMGNHEQGSALSQQFISQAEKHFALCRRFICLGEPDAPRFGAYDYAR